MAQGELEAEGGTGIDGLTDIKVVTCTNRVVILQVIIN